MARKMDCGIQSTHFPPYNASKHCIRAVNALVKWDAFKLAAHVIHFFAQYGGSQLETTADFEVNFVSENPVVSAT